jgi:hypothetical protein
MQILSAGVLYFTLVFGAGFVLGAIRIQWVIPRLGTGTAELLETPIMFVVMVVNIAVDCWEIRREKYAKRKQYSYPLLTHPE